MTNAADLIARRLYRAGCRQAFGIPGGEVLTLIKALADAGLEFVLAKHENSAGFMAEGAWHAGGAPGVLVATLGPGVANAVNVIANAEQDRVPLIFLTGCVDAAEVLTYTHQVLDHGALLKPITKASFTVPSGAASVVIDKAIAIALDDPPGPVHIDLPIQVAATQEIESVPIVRPQPRRGGPVDEQLSIAREWFKEAKRPLMVAGVEVLNQGAEETVSKLADQYNIPLITTYKAKGVLPEDHPLSLGGAGLSPKADDVLLPLVANSDLILLAGYDPIEMRTGWRDPWSAESRVVEFCSTPNTHYMHQAALSFVGDVGAGLRSLVADISPEIAGSQTTWTDGEPKAARQQLQSLFAGDQDWGPAAIIDTARRVLPRDTVATVDSGAHRILLSQMWQCYTPRTLLQSTGLCTMGCAVPLAIGYKVVNPRHPVVAFTGDAGLEMVLGELATLREVDVPVIVVVFADESLALIELKQRRTGHQNVGVDFSATDFVAIAGAMQMHGAQVDSRDALEKELVDALTRKQSTLIACGFDRKSYDGTF